MRCERRAKHAWSFATLAVYVLLAGSAVRGKAQDPSAKDTTFGPPSCSHCPLPGFPKKAGKIKEATVTLDVLVSSGGKALDVQIDKDPGNGFGEKAVEAVRKWKFKPATRNGEPVNARIKVEVQFKRV